MNFSSTLTPTRRDYLLQRVGLREVRPVGPISSTHLEQTVTQRQGNARSRIAERWCNTSTIAESCTRQSRGLIELWPSLESGTFPCLLSGQTESFISEETDRVQNPRYWLFLRCFNPLSPSAGAIIL